MSRKACSSSGTTSETLTIDKAVVLIHCVSLIGGRTKVKKLESIQNKKKAMLIVRHDERNLSQTVVCVESLIGWRTRVKTESERSRTE
jgi:hypothetical protein